MRNIFSRHAVLVITIVWVFFVVVLTFVKWNEIISLKPNDLGDFLSGIFAPLGFFWLVAGYYQQNEEQKKQNEVYEKELRMRRFSIEPKLDISKARYCYTIFDDPENNLYDELTLFYFEIFNYGKIAKDVEISGAGVNQTCYAIPSRESIAFRFHYSDQEDRQLSEYVSKELRIDLDMKYFDDDGNLYKKKIILVTDSFVHGAVGLSLTMRANLY